MRPLWSADRALDARTMDETAMKANKIAPDDQHRYKSASRPINWVHPIVQPRSMNARPMFVSMHDHTRACILSVSGSSRVWSARERSTNLQ